ncbi:hypothetical protein [Aequorivita lipolytica]|uniref:Uncharacterized protein n=1 Tax=Aequorivita lipolytica TaxID=153267 RepID=A0A5C6YSP6_9FLAO|nr:hypothetical protein [Aequorivita lipolytica]TXD69988.1 hypothetical protein ESV24_06025 [Aequorivita lipolytica]SRX50185.1 hypothetical protein AEQU2_00654 [Aequorivita lipolytica]
MKIVDIKYIGSAFFVCFVFIQTTLAQVGVGTTKPEGALHLKSTSQGLVIPRIALTAKNSENPVINPNGSNLVEGTVVYNTSKTKLGANDVYPGIYAWSGSEWNPQFIMEEYKKYTQTGSYQLTTIRDGYRTPRPDDADNVAGLTNQVFKPKYSGTYRIEVKTNFSAGKINDFTSLDKISLATMEGAFFFKINGAGVNIDPSSGTYDYELGWMYTHSYSAQSEIESPTIHESYLVPHFESVVHYVYFLADENYTFNLSNCMITGHEYFVGNGDTGDGQGRIGNDVPCTVEFTFIGD